MTQTAQQHQERQPGRERPMTPQPETEPRAAVGDRKLDGRVALISGGDSGIGRAVAIAFADQGADVAIIYLEEHEDAATTRSEVEARGRRCITIAGNVGDEQFCHAAVRQTVDALGKLDILVNNAAEQHPTQRLEEIDRDQIQRTFQTNISGSSS